jgi:hypothetical protein
LDDVKFDLCDTASNHSQRFGRSVGNVNNPAADVRTAVMTRTVTDCPLATFVTRNRVPNGNVGWAAVNSCVLNFSPDAVFVPSV